MKTVLLTLAILISITVSYSQETKQKLTREQKKELKAQQEEAQRQLVTQLITDRRFVLEAYQLRNKQGNSVNVNSNINFILIDSVEAVFQFGSAQMVGVNGVGGLTIEGTVSKWETTFREKSGSYFIRLTLSSRSGFFDITLNVMASGSADATVSTMGGGQLNYSGNIIPLEMSSVYKGMAR